jgi:hypothetical protein
MIERADADFATNLQRAILKVLNGDMDAPGLYRTVLSSQSWEQFRFTAGVIHGYETVLQEMQNIVRRMNGDDQRESNQTNRNLS